MNRVAVALDIGGTKTAAATVTADGAVLTRAKRPTPAARGARAVLDNAVELAREVGVGHEVVGVGVGSAGVVDPDTGLVRSATDALPGWAGTDLRGHLTTELGAPVAVANDVHAHALGEYLWGAARGGSTVLLVAVGTGVGGALLCEGRIHSGARAAAGHAGHVPVAAAAGRHCPCGAEGHVESVASGPALVAEYTERGGGAVTRLEEVVALADRDPVARSVLVDGATALGSALAGLANVFDPDVIVVGGGVAGAGPDWWSALTEETERGLVPALRGLPVVPAALGADAALLGAAHLAWREVEKTTWEERR
ncbi:ROK family protein [Nocardiopsis sp. JB363]|uniref:ROK family protein n=1 Tax=Nocardiopsis sp. JB363 TaxID=1434837 RepID=UPI00097B7DB2|nr:ROK family protein [Nocardiopsis sp. JB363]SIO87258.1 N-acetylmannosamine kinase [Nocardiopsis sp. JB363]